ncbi:MAG: elongation factor G, partial [Deltaproteobacteria bacterium]|nr:elongation factor G [Deltaproteobacteria bacterium]
MKDVAKQRTIALISHGGSGKTTMAEAFLFLTKVSSRFGSVADGTSVLDFEPEEIKRKSSLSTSFHSFPWKKNQITFADTPGGENFLNDTRTAMQGVDASAVLVDAVDMVKVSTEKGWAFSDAFELPRIVVINKMDRERADFFKTLENIQEIFSVPKAVPLTLPIGSENSFTGLVDLLKQKAYTYDAAGKASEGDIPADMADLAAQWREKLIENIAETNDTLIEKFLEGGELTNEELNTALREAVLSGQIAPVTSASGLKLIGLDIILDMIINLLPSPLERKPFLGANSAEGEAEISKAPDPAAPFSGLVIKTTVDP